MACSGISPENARVEFYQQGPEPGKRRFQIPEIDLREVMDSTWWGFWHPMPDGRKALLLAGLLAFGTVKVVWFKKRNYRVRRG